jgi:hypothetical protein
MGALTRRVQDIHRPGSAPRKLFVLTGTEGTVTFEISGDPPVGGPIEIHYPVAASHDCPPGSTPPNECEFAPSGRCRADQAFRAGADAQEHYIAGDSDAVFAEMQSWYDSRLRPWGIV